MKWICEVYEGTTTTNDIESCYVDCVILLLEKLIKI
jgi:hypothetical protein